MHREKEPVDHNASEPVVDKDIASEITDAVSSRLKQDYDSLVAEPVPSRFTDLLDELSKLSSPAPQQSAPSPAAHDHERAHPSDGDQKTADESHPEPEQGA